MSLTGRDEKGIQELDRCITDKLMRRLREVEQERDELAAHCELLTKVLIDVEGESTSGYYDIPAWLYSDVIEVMNANPEKSLAKHDADVIDTAINKLYKYIGYGATLSLQNYSDQLRKQRKV